MEFLPRVEEAPGWRLIGEPLVYPASDLPSYLGREAQPLVQYELQDATIGEYQQVEGQGRATVEIYRFPDFVKAFGAFSSRSEAERRPLEIVNLGFLGRYSAHAWRGAFYVRVVATGTAEEPLVGLLRAVVDRMPPAPALPAVFQFLPSENRVPRSERYVAGPVFGQPYLAGGFTAEYALNEQRIEGAIIPAPSKEVATEILNRYRAFFATNGRLLDPIPNLGEDNITAEDRYFGRTIAFRLDRFVIVFRSFGTIQDLLPYAIATDQRILNSIRQQLQEAERAARQRALEEQRARATGSRPAQPAAPQSASPPPPTPAAQPEQTPPP